MARAGRYGEDEDAALENNLSIIGFQEVPSLEHAQDFDAVLKLLNNYFSDKNSRTVRNYAGQLYSFALAMREGDIVVLPRKSTSQIALGRVTGVYKFQQVNSHFRHTRPVEWLRPDVPRTAFRQDLLYSFGAFLTVCQISRNDAARRVAAVLEGKSDPGPSGTIQLSTEGALPADSESDTLPDLQEAAHDQIVAQIQSRFAGHELTRLVDAVLRADGWETTISAPGPDGGVDILAARGPLGLDSPRLCVQVKSQDAPTDVNVYRSLQGTVQAFNADQGLLVCWGGFTKAVRKEAKQGHFALRLWDSRDLVNAIYRNYEQLPAEIKAELPLQKVWMLVLEESDA